MPISSKPSQEFVPIKEIREGVVIFKDSSMRAVIMVSSINFALKSEDTQNAIISQFQNLLNSLDFSIQIFIESRRLDIRPYLATLEERYRAQVIDLMKVQIKEYIEFIRSFTEGANIMTKSFFVVIPYSSTLIKPGAEGISSVVNSIPGLNKKKETENTDKKTDDFEENRAQLEQRVAVVEQGLVRCGVRSARLGTEELVELYYRLFNPGETDKPMKVG